MDSDNPIIDRPSPAGGATGPLSADELRRMNAWWHACNYLLTVDMEMEPVPGFKAASWAKGYGDFVIKPDLGTLRRVLGFLDLPYDPACERFFENEREAFSVGI